jgi:hypothetical protein
MPNFGEKSPNFLAVGWENFLKAITIKAGNRLRISNFSEVSSEILRNAPPGPPPPQDQESRGTSP